MILILVDDGQNSGIGRTADHSEEMKELEEPLPKKMSDAEITTLTPVRGQTKHHSKKQSDTYSKISDLKGRMISEGEDEAKSESKSRRKSISKHVQGSDAQSDANALLKKPEANLSNKKKKSRFNISFFKKQKVIPSSLFFLKTN